MNISGIAECRGLSVRRTCLIFSLSFFLVCVFLCPAHSESGFRGRSKAIIDPKVTFGFGLTAGGASLWGINADYYIGDDPLFFTRDNSIGLNLGIFDISEISVTLVYKRYFTFSPLTTYKLKPFAGIGFSEIIAYDPNNLLVNMGIVNVPVGADWNFYSIANYNFLLSAEVVTSVSIYANLIDLGGSASKALSISRRLGVLPGLCVKVAF